MERTRANSNRSNSSTSSGSNQQPSRPMTRSRMLSQLADPATMPSPVISHNHARVWIRQNRNLERQRAYYANYYFERNRMNNSANITAGQNVPPAPPMATQAAATAASFSVQPTNDVTNASTQTNSSSPSSSSVAATVVPPTPLVPASVEVQPNVPSTSSSSTLTTNMEHFFGPNENVIFAAPLGNMHNYLRALSAIIEIRGLSVVTARPLSTITVTTSANQVQASGSNNTNSPASRNSATNSHNSASSNNNNMANVDQNNAFFLAFSDMAFGLSKQEIDRHTISYVYKPRKRKRMKSVSNEDHSSPSESCSICLDQLRSCSFVRRLPCLHVFHIKCIDKWLKTNKKCPICRIAITINYDTLMTSLKSGTSIDQCLTQQETSVRELVALLQQNPDSNNNNNNSASRITATTAASSEEVAAAMRSTAAVAAGSVGGRNRMISLTMHIHNDDTAAGTSRPNPDHTRE